MTFIAFDKIGFITYNIGIKNYIVGFKRICYVRSNIWF